MRYIAGIRKAALLCFVGLLTVSAECAAAQEIVPPQVTKTCRSCHGEAGDSSSSDIPRLNGQQAEYLVARLKSFLFPGSQDPHSAPAMWNTQPVSDAMLETIAKYYVRQAPAQARSTGPLVTEGRELYANGDIAERLPACEQCHGMYAEGKGATPRLAGQHGAYLENQLNGFRLGLREGNVMHPATMNMTDDQIAAIVAYLAND